MAHSEQEIASLVMLITFFIFGAVGNGLVAYVYTHKAKKDSATIFILALSCTDLLACLVAMPFTAVKEYLHNKLNYDLACKLYKFIITFTVPLSAFLMVLISVDRYFSICHALLHTVTPQRAKIVLLFPVLLAITIGSISASTEGVYASVTLNLQCESDDLFRCLNHEETNDYLTTIDPIMNRTAGHEDISQNMISTVNPDMDIREYKPALSIEEDATVQYATTASEFIEKSLSDFNEHVYITREHKTTTYTNDETIDHTKPTLPGPDSITSDSTTPEKRKFTVTIYACGYCVFSDAFLSHDAMMTFQKVYASFYLISFIVVLAFYLRIYVFVVRRRGVRSSQKIQTGAISRDERAEVTKPKTETKNVINVISSDVCLPDDTVKLNDCFKARRGCSQSNGDLSYVESKVDNTKSFVIGPDSRSKNEIDRVNNNDKDRAESMLSANVRTAAMLFVVAVIFILCFLPAWLMAIRIIPYQSVVFYAYFFYNVANPLIYAFMNETFRKEMKRLFRIGVVNQRSL